MIINLRTKTKDQIKYHQIDRFNRFKFTVLVPDSRVVRFNLQIIHFVMYNNLLHYEDIFCFCIMMTS